jgi:hypothetical protein
MISALPDNEINKELKARLHNMDVGTETFKFYVSKVTSAKDRFYFLVNTQLNSPDNSKCGTGWIHATEIQVVCMFPKNTGSKALLNQATNDVIQELQDFSLPVASNISVSLVTINVENELVEDTAGEVVYRKILRLELRVR